MLKTLLSLSRLKYGLTSLYCNGKHISVRFYNQRTPIQVNHTKMDIHIIPALQDNYMYLIIDKDTREAAVVDPVSPEDVVCEVKKTKCKLTKVLTTHHHWDHAGGNKDLARLVSDLQFYGGDDRIDCLTCKVSDGNVISLANIKIQCLYTPCHTQGHICYYLTKEGSQPAVFTGDTLFSAGCGRFFEGTADQMYKNLCVTLAKLPDETKVYCGHEYTVNNLQFAGHVEPTNEAIKEKMKLACSQRQSNLPTIPSTIGEEKLFNPFMRVHEPTVQEFAKKRDPVQVMGVLREKKDCFRAS